MIITNKDLRQYLEKECPYLSKGSLRKLSYFLLQPDSFVIERYLSCLRKTEFYYNNRFQTEKRRFMYEILYALYSRRLNSLGRKLGFDIGLNTINVGLKIYHKGFVTINCNSRIGKNFVLHGCNCVGNKGEFSSGAPVIGNNVTMGVGSSVIGNVTIADDVIIGAGAVVISDISEKGAIVGGIPAKILNRKY